MMTLRYNSSDTLCVGEENSYRCDQLFNLMTATMYIGYSMAGLLSLAIICEVIKNMYYRINRFNYRYQLVDSVVRSTDWCSYNTDSTMYSNGVLTILFYVLAIIFILAWTMVVIMMKSHSIITFSTGFYFDLTGIILLAINFCSCIYVREKGGNVTRINGVPFSSINM